MKLKHVKYLLAIGLISTIGTMNAQSKIKVKADVTNMSSTMKKFNVHVYEYGKLVKTLKNKSGKFSFTVPKDTEYMLEVVADNHYTRRIAFDSKGSSASPEETYKLDMNLLRKDFHEYMGEHEDLLDLPLAFIGRDANGSFIDKNQSHSVVLNDELKTKVQDILVSDL